MRNDGRWRTGVTLSSPSMGASSLTIRLIVLWAVVLRIGPLLFTYGTGAELPNFHSGGLFWAFSEAIRENNFLLPRLLPHYSVLGIPFSYPPLAFYLVALSSEVLGTGPKSILILNLLLSTLGVLAYLLFLKRCGLTRPMQSLALLAYCSLPILILEQLPGEGLAECFGALFFVLFARDLFGLESQEKEFVVVRTGVILGFCVLSSPGSAFAAPLTLILYCLTRLRLFVSGTACRLATRNLFLLLCVSLFISGYYLAHVVYFHGPSFLVEALEARQSTGLTSIVSTIASHLVLPSHEVSPWHMVAFLGLVHCALARQFFWPAWALLLASVSREGQWLVAVVIPVLATRGYFEVVQPILIGVLRSRLACQLALGAIISYSSIVYPVTAVWLGAPVYRNYVNLDEAEYLVSLRHRVPLRGPMVVFGNEIEWAPFLARVPVLNVWYGAEWVPERQEAIGWYNERIGRLKTSQELAVTLQAMRATYPHLFPLPEILYFSKKNLWPRGGSEADERLIEDLKESPCWTLLDEQDSVVTFVVNHSIRSQNEVECASFLDQGGS